MNVVVVGFLTVVIMLFVGVFTWKKFEYFYLSRQKKYRNSPYELLKMKLTHTIANMAVVGVFGIILIHELMTE